MLGVGSLVIDAHEFEIYEQIILTGQMPEHRVISFLADNAEFAAWYRARALRRRGDPLSSDGAG